MTNHDHFRRLERLYKSAPISRLYGASIEIDETRTVVTAPIKSEFFHAGRAPHGSVYFRLLDDAAYCAVQATIEDAFIVTTSFNIYFVRPATGKTLRAEGRLLHSSSRLCLAESWITDEEGKTLARGTGSFMKSTIPLADVFRSNEAEEQRGS